MGQKLAAYQTDPGPVTAFYDEDICKPPSGVLTIAITDAEWADAVSSQNYQVSGGKLVAPAAPTAAQALVSAQQKQISGLRMSCGEQIVAGFQSSALGSAHTYPSKQTDQINLIGLHAGGNGGAFWCADSTGAWSYAAHTADQIAQVLADGIAAREALSAKLKTLTGQVMAATTVADVQAVVW